MVNFSVVSVYFVDSLQVGARKDQPRYTVGQFQSVEIDDQSKWNIKQLHVAEQLSLVDRQHLFNSFYFDKQAVVISKSKRSGSSR